jgi:iron complex transport system substrate-binding protein
MPLTHKTIGPLIRTQQALALLLLCLLVLPACDNTTDSKARSRFAVPAKPDAETRLFIDDLGRTRKIPKDIKRLVVLSGPAVEVAFALGRGGDIVARSEWATWPPAMQKLPSLGSIIRPNQELIWELKPDVIVADMHFMKSAAFMERMGVPVLFLSAVHIKEIPRLIKRMGKLLKQPTRAGRLMQFVRDHLEMITRPLAKLEPGQKPLVFHGSGRQLYFTSSSKYGRRVTDVAGAKNIANSLPLYWQRVSPEWVVKKNPDFMVLSPNLARYDFKVPSQKIMAEQWCDSASRPGIRSLELVRKGRLIMLNSRLGYGLRAFLGAVYLAKRFHPELFPDLDPHKVHAEFLQRFFDLELEGSYVYP